MHHLHLDFETASDLDLKDVGLYRYIEDKSFTPLCVAWKLDAGDPEAAILDNNSLPTLLLDLLHQPDVQAHAWNAAFEDRILRNHYGIHPARPLSCTMQRALAYGLPARLEKAGAALNTKAVKDMRGYRLMLKMSKLEQVSARKWSDEDWQDLMAYCIRDVETEAEISHLIPELSEAEKELSALDRLMNLQGIWLDRKTVAVLTTAARLAEKREAERATALSGGKVTSPGTQSMRLVAWLRDRGLDIPDVSRETIQDAMTGTPTAPLVELPSDDVVEMLEIRLRTARASTKKLERMTAMVTSGSRLRGQFQFLGAGRTGRWAGRGIQPQNLPRVPKGFDPPLFAGMARAAIASNRLEDLDMVAPAPVLDCVSWSLRSCLGAGNGEMLWGFDFAQIEARVLAWLAGQEDVLEAFRRGEDIYTWAAKQFGSDNRQLGKVLVLALGYGMGAAKLRDTARKQYGVTLSKEEAEHFKNDWRAKNRKITEFWDNIEAAARAAILNPGKVYPVLPSAITITSTAKTMQIRLPSGRVLYYHRPRVVENGGICYDGEELGKWVERKTWGGTLAENVTQAVARDIMAEAMLRVEPAPLMTIHDELVYALQNEADGEELRNLMLEVPEWAGGLPIAGEAKLMSRYGLSQGTV